MQLPVLHLLVAAAIVAAGVLAPRLWLAAQRSRPIPVDPETRARAMMSELCPYGWRAEISLRHGAPVSLRWHELRADGGEPAVVRHVRGASVAAALQAMVADRLTDRTLEQIELQAAAGGIAWPDD